MSYWQGKVAIVTGGSAGLGLAIAEALGDRGASVMIAARDGGRLHEAVGRLQQKGHRGAGFATDVTDAEQVDSLIDRTISEFGRLDMLVNNVGRSTRGNVLDTGPDEFRELLELNFLSVVRCTQAAAPHLIESRGHVVNIGSLASKSVSKFLGAYPASKFAVAAYSQQLRLELQPQGVHVLLVCPGPIAREDAGQRYDAETRDLPDSARQPGGGVKLRGIPPDRLAARILRACEQRRLELIVPARARWLFAISQLWPSLGDRIIAKMNS
ncbi:MAG: SDR family NAD(P)-dependent oxidoreductase [Planctomycetota bacterium]|nr:SDR family NAD(P)-dependent oxidoreductase [Planctomycetota bacterium]